MMHGGTAVSPHRAAAAAMNMGRLAAIVFSLAHLHPAPAATPSHRQWGAEEGRHKQRIVSCGPHQAELPL